MPLITKDVASDGFGNAANIDFMSADSLAACAQLHGLNIDISVETEIASLKKDLTRIKTIRIPFAKFSDGRGFSLARQLRELGFNGRLRACGHLVSDQFAFILQCGLDEVEISAELAERQPANYWQEALDVSFGYRKKLAYSD